MLQKKFNVAIQKNKSRLLVRKNVIFILGGINFLDATDILLQYNILLSKFLFNIVIISLKYLVWANTSMLLLMLNFLKVSNKKNVSIEFINVPVFLLELSKVYNLKNILYKN